MNKKQKKMKLLNIRSIQLNDMTFHIKMTNRAMIEFEEMSGGNMATLKGTNDLLMLFYCTSKAGAKAKDIPFDITFQQFVDVTDEHYFEIITKFSEALAELGGGEKKLKVSQ